MVTIALSLAILNSGQNSASREVDTILARIAKPREGDQKRLEALGDVAFIRVLPIVEKKVKKADPTRNAPEFTVYARYLTYLCACATPRRTPEMTALYNKVDDTPKDWIFWWLADKGEPVSNRKLFERTLASDEHQRKGIAARGLTRIGDEPAIKFLGKSLSDPEITPENRRDLCWNLASIGKPSALDIVRKTMHKGRTLPILANRAKIPTANTDILSVTTDDKGATWGLMTWDGLGSPEDLWIVKKAGNQWTEPTFIGVSKYWPRWIPTGTPVEGFEKHEAQMQALIQDKGWVANYLHNPIVTKDSDRDGYTDITERWLGTDPAKADTDDDGILDGLDKNPFAKPHLMSDRDKAMQSALSLFCLATSSPNRNLMAEIPDDAMPFEVESSQGPVYTRYSPKGNEVRNKNLFGLYLRLSPTVKQLNKEGTMMELEVIESGGYYMHNWAVTVKKFGDEWFCVALNLRSAAVS